MKVLFVLTYYRPHISGLAIYVQRLAEGLAERGHTVTVLTSQYDPALPADDILNGVRIVRAPVAFRLSKGVIMLSFPRLALHLLCEHDVVSVHLPQFEASLLGVLARLVVRRPMILTYHCDLRLPAGLFNRFVDQVVFVSNYVSGLLADRIVASTRDYAEHSRFLSRFLDKFTEIPPPVAIPDPQAGAEAEFLAPLGLDNHPTVGFAARLAAEKGAEYLLEALEYILPEVPDVRVLFTGENKALFGEDDYHRRLQPLIERYADHVTFLGVLSFEQLAEFYAACDVLVLPSLNSTESFGMVQVEAMLCGTPVVASNLPGVRQPVHRTGMGRIVRLRNARELATAVLEVLKHPDTYVKPHEDVARHFHIERVLADYEVVFRTAIQDVLGTSTSAIGDRDGMAAVEK